MFPKRLAAWFRRRAGRAVKPRARNVLAVAGIVGILAGMAILGLLAPSRSPFEAKLLRTQAYRDADSKLITVEFTKHATSRAWFDDDARNYQVQLRLNGRWQAPVAFAALPDQWLSWRTNRHDIVFMVPAQTQACRFRLGYHRDGRSAYCTAYFFLQRHGWSKRYPKLCRQILKCFEYRVRLRHAAIEVALAE